MLARAVVWGMIDVNPAKQGVDNPQRRRTEKRPFESWAQLEAVAATLEPRASGPMVIFAAATGLRPGEWIALERRDIDREARVVYVRRAFSNGRLKCTKTEAASAPCRSRRSRSRRSTQLPRARYGRCSSRRLAAATSTCTTSATATGSPPSSPPGSPVPTRLRSSAHLRHLRAPCRHLNLRSLPLHGRQPDHDRPPLRPPRPRRPRPRDPAFETPASCPQDLSPSRRLSWRRHPV